MSEWPILSLREAGVELFDCEHKTPPPVKTGYPFVAIPQLKNGRIDLTNVRYISHEHFNEWTRRVRPKPNDIVLSRRCNPGETAVVPKGLEFALGQNLVILRANGNKVFPEFLRWLVRGPDWWMQINSFINVGAIFDSLKCADIPNFTLPIPPLPEQRAIAGVLSSLDDKIDLLHRQNKTLEAMAETLFRQWFVEEAEDGWNKCTLEDLCNVIGSGGTPSTKIDSYYNGDINWYSTKELQDNFLYESDTKITQEGLNNSAAKLFPPKTVLIAIYAAPTVGRLGILGNESSFNQAACGLVANEEMCYYEFIYLFLKNQRNELNLVASGSAQQNLNVGKIKTYPAFIVPKEIMTDFKEIVRSIFDRINTNTILIHTLEKLRDALLPRLLSGEVRVRTEVTT